MAQLIVRGIEEAVKHRLKARAARHGQSMEAEVRDILQNALKDDEPAEGQDADRQTFRRRRTEARGGAGAAGMGRNQEPIRGVTVAR